MQQHINIFIFFLIILSAQVAMSGNDSLLLRIYYLDFGNVSFIRTLFKRLIFEHMTFNNQFLSKRIKKLRDSLQARVKAVSPKTSYV